MWPGWQWPPASSTCTATTTCCTWPRPTAGRRFSRGSPRSWWVRMAAAPPPCGRSSWRSGARTWLRWTATPTWTGTGPPSPATSRGWRGGPGPPTWPARGGVLVAHVRNEAEGLPGALEEMAGLHRATGVPLHVSHLKLIGRANWHLADQVLGFFEGARAAGIDIIFDQYPYTAGSTLLSVVLPPWAREGGVEATLARLRAPAARERMRRDIARGIPGWENIAGLCGWEGIMG